MSQKISNLYAARIFAEHPIALWSLDDDFSFISKLSEPQLDISNWSLTNLSEISPFTSPTGIKILESSTVGLTIVSGSAGFFGSASANPINSINDLDSSKSSISINAFIYDFEGFINNVQIGFVYSGSAFYSTYNNIDLQEWTKISHTITVPSENTDIYPYFKVNYEDPGVDVGEQFNIAINGLSVGQWSELFHYQDVGTFSNSLSDSNLLSILSASSSLSASAITHVVADSYGISDPKNGYYIVEGNRMLSTNNNFPITFGATNITNIIHPLSGNIPSLVFPGQGFLNQSGQFKEFTAEFWLRCYTNVITPIKIFGPIISEDGIYIDRDYITIKIGPYRQSYFIGKWYRPVLIDFRYGIENSSLLINGELVITMDLNQDKITMPIADHDYVGFFGNEYVYPLDVDALAIYPYQVSEQIAKRRYVYAQGVESADNIAANFKADSFNVDFPFAKYTSTINYPDMNDWNSGFFNNAISTSKYITTPEYSLPEIIFDSEVDIEDFLIDNYNAQGSDYPFIKLKPNSSYDEIDSSIYFSTINVLNNPIKTLFGIFRAPTSLSATEETLMLFTNNFNNNTLTVKVSSAGVKYYFNTTLLYTESVTANTLFLSGFNIDTLSSNFSSIIGNFFSNPQNISLRLGGNNGNMFNGKIHLLTFNNNLFTQKDLSTYILNNGFFDSSIEPESLLNYIGNYTFYPRILSKSLVLDIGANGYWEDSIPLSYFGKFVQNKAGSQYYDLDLIQFNIDSPSSLTIQQELYYVLDGGLSTTLDFSLYFDSGTPETLDDDFVLTFDGGTPETLEFVEYLTAEELDIAYGSFSRPDHTVKMYMTIQDKDDVGTIPYTNYTNVQRIGSDRVLDFDNVSEFTTTKYEIVDRTIVFPPKEQVNFEDYYITIHMELQSRGINKNPIKIRKMSLSSLAYDETDFYSINSPNGYKLYPFSRSENTYIFKQKNPFTIYKDTTSYMHMSSDSGINVLPYSSPAEYRGLTVPINQQLSTEYLLGGVQFWGFYNKDKTINENIQLGKIYTRNDAYDIWLIPEDNNRRGKIVLYDGDTTNESSGVVFYQNGQIVDNPYITPLSWNSIIITFDESLILDNIVGQFEIYEGIMVNNIAFYKKSSDILGSTVVDKTWQEVRAESVWDTWFSEDYEWQILDDKVVTQTFIVDGKSIYDSTFGLSSAVSDDNNRILFNSDGAKIVTGTIWAEFSQRPV